MMASKIGTWAGLVLGLGTAAGAVESQAETRPPVSAVEIGEWVRALGDASYDARTAATRQLCVIGVEAREALRTAAGGPDAEVSIRATQLLSIFDQLLFAGTEINLEFSKTTIAWNEAVDLRVTVTNRSRYAARIPFEVGNSIGGAAAGDARQVADMLDTAEWLRVRAPDGRELELRMDDIAGDVQVAAIVQARLNGGVGSTVPPGESVTIIVRDFNRGWARYAALDEGEYTAVLDYAPDWTDSALVTARAGRVVSNVARLRVKEGASSKISRGGAEAEVIVERVGDAYAARLENRRDQPMTVNTNFGASLPFASGAWIIESNGNRRDVAVSARLGQTWSDFETSRLIEVEPGGSVELARIAVEAVRKTVQDAGGLSGRPTWGIRFVYTSLCDRNWQTRQGPLFARDESVPPVLREPLPRRMLNTRLTSEPLPLPMPDE